MVLISTTVWFLSVKQLLDDVALNLFILCSFGGSGEKISAEEVCRNKLFRIKAPPVLEALSRPGFGFCRQFHQNCEELLVLWDGERTGGFPGISFISLWRD